MPFWKASWACRNRRTNLQPGNCRSSWLSPKLQQLWRKQMRLSSFLLDGKATYGVVDERGVIDLGARFVGRYADLKALLAGNGLTEAEVYARSDYVDAKVD